MKTRFVSLIVLLAVVVAITFAARQRTLNQLRGNNGKLRQQLEAQTMPVESNSALKVQPTNAVEELSAEERNEVLRLRGQIAPLLSELQSASNHMAEFAQAKPDRTARVSEQGTNSLPPKLQAHQQVMAAYRAAPDYMEASGFSLALQKYLSQNGGQLPDDLTKVERYGGSGLRSGVSQRFEQMQSGPVPEEARAYTLFAREKNPQPQADGWWSRIYFFADGSMTMVSRNSSAPDWTASERNAETRARKRAEQKQKVVDR